MNNDIQVQSEALIRLLIASRYQDAKLSLAETDSLQKHIEEIPWDSGTVKNTFVMTETARVRDALSDADAKQEFLKTQCGQFEADDEKRYVVKSLEEVFKSDGLDPRESEFLNQVKSLLGL